MTINHFQVKHRHSRRLMADVLEKRADSSTCPNFYLAPTMGQTVNSLDPLTISWNSTCLSDKAIDIYLYSPGAALPRIHVWEGIAVSRGTYNATLMPRWWNSTSSQSLQVSIVPSGQAPFLSSFPGGPVITATYTAPASGAPSSADTNAVSSGITQVNDLANAKKHLTPGKTAAAVLLTLLFVGLCIAGYIKMKRNKGKEERRRWTEAVDKRMSTISTDWKSVSAAGANAAIRNSIAVGSFRSSTTFAVEGEDEKRSMSTGVGPRNPITPVSTERVSRVSFAPDTRTARSSVADSRPSGESRRTRAFHTAYVPPVPSLPADESDSGSLSPRQSQGPLTLTPDDIRARIAANKRSSEEMDEVMPALRMMRTGSDPSAPDDLLLVTPNPPEPAYPKPIVAPQHTASPVMPMEPMPANVMSPDEMLRAYAERKKSISNKPVTSPPPSSSPIKAIAKKVSKRSNSKHEHTGSNTMRVLYNANTGSLSSTDTVDAYAMAYRQSVGVTPGIIEESQEVENAHPFGYHPNAAYGGHYAIGDDEDDVGVAGVAGRGAGTGQVYLAHAT